MRTESAPLQSPAPLDLIPPQVRAAQDYETLATDFIEPARLAYVAGGAGHDQTASANRSAFSAWSMLPRVLRDVTAGHTRLSLVNENLAHPILLAPVAHQRLVHARAEIETARAAEATQSCMVASTLSSVALEDIARAAGPHKWFQLYFQPQRADTLGLVRRAEQAGFGALVVTLDATLQAPSLRALRAGFRMPPECVAANLRDASRPPELPALQPGDSRIFQGLMRGAPTLQDLEWLLAQTTLPVWIKGVLHAGDAAVLATSGACGLIVSNHGGRTLDGAPSSLQMLPAIRAAVPPRFPLLFDGGVRSGADAFKAIALGADAVMVGRLQVYALSVAGALGVAHMIKLMREELEASMAFAGCATLEEVRADCLTPACMT
ncbi:MAG: alpha-hydroxy-acid oxidizing protein [Gammaproteobacteria bacterium]|nr:alpha-hydroxy-acid oxidizing protein [Gammaproteobacteria bacterium]